MHKSRERFSLELKFVSISLSIKIGKKHITRVKYVKFLGLLLDDTLS